MSDSAYVRVPSSRFVVEHLPDGSAAVFDTSSNAAHSLNSAAVLAWESCDEPARVSDVARALRVAGAAVDETIARDTLTRLAEIGLIARTAPPADTRVMPRRAAVRSIAASIPVILTLTAMQQRVHAQVAGSGVPTTIPPTTTTGLPTRTTTTTTTTTTPLPPTTTPAP